MLIAVVSEPNLIHEEDVLATDATLLDGSAHALLVLVGLRRVYHPVAHTQRIAHATFTLFRADLKHSVTQNRHLNAVV